MLQIYSQAADPGGYEAYGAFGAFGDPAGVRALQETLRKIGFPGISVSGTVDGPTAASIYRLIRDRGSSIPLLPSQIKTAVDKVRSFDSKIRQYTFEKFDSASLLQYVSTVLSIIRQIPSVGSSVANAIQSGVNEIFNAINMVAGPLNTAVTLLYFPKPAAAGPTPLPPPPPLTQPSPLPSSTPSYPTQTYPTQLPPSSTMMTTPRSSIYARSRGRIRVAVPRTQSGFGGIGILGTDGSCLFGDCELGALAPYLEKASTDVPPAGGTEVTETEFEKQTGQLPLYKKPLFWVAVAGGVVVVGGGGYLLFRQKPGSK